MTIAGTPWRLCVRAVTKDPDRPGDIIGAGFVVTGREALTCAHVVGTERACWVEPLDGSYPPRLCEVDVPQPEAGAAGPAPDVAVIRFPQQVYECAPLGPYEPPAVGTRLEVVGYPKRYAGGEEQVAHVRVMNAPVRGRIQVDGFPGHARIVVNYSGGAALDMHSKRVVGMVVTFDTDPSSVIAWIIPLSGIAEVWKPLEELLPTRISVDPEFRSAISDLELCSYQEALRRLNAIYKYYPREADMSYYRALAALDGRRPGGYPGSMIESIVRLLEHGLSLNPGAPHIKALLALVDEDYYQLRGLKKRIPPSGDIASISTVHAREIVRHVRAEQCATWIILKEMLRWK